MKKILFPTDFSSTANNAFIYALHIAKKMNASILTLHTYALPDVGSSVGFVLPTHLKEFYDSIDINELESFREALPALRKIADENGFDQIEMTHTLEMGDDPKRTILQTAEEQNVDLIVMGTKGARGLKEIFVGSNTAHVMENADCPVVVVPEKAVFDNRLDKIAITTEFAAAEEKAIMQTVEFAQHFDAAVECINVDIFHTHQYYDRMAKMAKQYEGTPNLSFKVLDGNDIEPTILSYLKDNETDMLVMLTQKRSFFEKLFHYSVAKQMAYHSTIPIMAIKVKS